MFRIILAVIITVATTGTVWADTLTGCLTSRGGLIRLQAGDTPSSPCTGSQTQVSIALAPVATGAYEFVGFSADTATGGVGIPAMNAACQAVYGDQARFATTAEYLNSPDAVVPPPGVGWIKPVVAAGDGVNATDVSGVVGVDAGDLSCSGWSTSSPTRSGMVVTPLGALAATGGAFCNNSNFVACSAP